MEKHDEHKKLTGEEGPALPEDLKPRDYLRLVKIKLAKNKQREAFELLQRAAVDFPEDPFILSYYGCLQGIVDRKYRAGVETCKRALALIEQSDSFGEELLYPVFYLNLGRAYVAAGKKKEAFEIFSKGLRFDSSNQNLLREVRALGKRKTASVTFLDRSNLINKYIGLMLRKSDKDAENQNKPTAVRFLRDPAKRP